MLNTKVLVLNRSYLPVHVTSVRRAFILLYQDIARAVDEQYRTFDFASWSELAVSVEHDSIGMVSRVVRVRSATSDSAATTSMRATITRVSTAASISSAPI